MASKDSSKWGVGPDQPTETNEAGASQSSVPFRFDLMDPGAMFEMGRVLKEGADKYGEGNWRGIPLADHLNHLIGHAYAYLGGDRTDDHLSHIMSRAMMAQAVVLDHEKPTKEDPERAGALDTPERILNLVGNAAAYQRQSIQMWQRGDEHSPLRTATLAKRDTNLRDAWYLVTTLNEEHSTLGGYLASINKTDTYPWALPDVNTDQEN